MLNGLDASPPASLKDPAYALWDDTHVLIKPSEQEQVFSLIKCNYFAKYLCVLNFKSFNVVSLAAC